MTPKIKLVLAITAGVVALAFVGWQFVLPRVLPVPFYGHVMPGGEPAPAIDLVGPNGEEVSLTDFEGQVVVLFFGYTLCPDICPTSLSKMARAMDMLGEKADEVQVLFVSVDPPRDTPEVLAKFVAHFHPSFIGLTGDPGDINRIATQYGAYYEVGEKTSAAGYLINHTATFMVIDKGGEYKLLISYDLTDEQMAADLANLVG